MNQCLHKTIRIAKVPKTTDLIKEEVDLERKIHPKLKPGISRHKISQMRVALDSKENAVDVGKAKEEAKAKNPKTKKSLMPPRQIESSSIE